MKHRAFPRMAVAAALALAASTFVYAPAAATDDDSLVYVIGGDIGSLNLQADDGATVDVIRWLYNALYAYDAHLRPVPDIAADFADVSMAAASSTSRPPSSAVKPSLGQLGYLLDAIDAWADAAVMAERAGRSSIASERVRDIKERTGLHPLPD